MVKHTSVGGLLKAHLLYLMMAAGKLAAIFLWLVVYSGHTALAQSTGIWQAGAFTFSDELGGFSIMGVSGVGTKADPIIIRQSFNTAHSATLIIRAAPKSRPKVHADLGASRSTIYLRIETINNSSLPWVGFGFELQEQLDVASTYSDGLSFDQLSRRDDEIFSDRFQNFEDEFEPGDRLIYRNGFVDHTTSVAMNFVITDFTPAPKFYLYQDPLIPAS